MSKPLPDKIDIYRLRRLNMIYFDQEETSDSILRHREFIDDDNDEVSEYQIYEAQKEAAGWWLWDPVNMHGILFEDLFDEETWVPYIDHKHGYEMARTEICQDPKTGKFHLFPFFRGENWLPILIETRQITLDNAARLIRRAPKLLSTLFLSYQPSMYYPAVLEKIHEQELAFFFTCRNCPGKLLRLVSIIMTR